MVGLQGNGSRCEGAKRRQTFPNGKITDFFLLFDDVIYTPRGSSPTHAVLPYACKAWRSGPVSVEFSSTAQAKRNLLLLLSSLSCLAISAHNALRRAALSLPG